MASRPFVHLCAALGLVAVLGGCALIERAEAVFMQQHRASEALFEAIVVAETENPVLAERLYDTEAEFNDICAPLNAAGYRRLFGDEIDGDLKWAVILALEECSTTTGEVERLLWRVDPKTAGRYLGKPGRETSQ